jgi:hypothetical protein
VRQIGKALLAVRCVLLDERELMVASLKLAGEAEASSAGEQLAKDYLAGTHRTDVL